MKKKPVVKKKTVKKKTTGRIRCQDAKIMNLSMIANHRNMIERIVNMEARIASVEFEINQIKKPADWKEIAAAALIGINQRLTELEAKLEAKNG